MIGILALAQRLRILMRLTRAPTQMTRLIRIAPPRRLLRKRMSMRLIFSWRKRIMKKLRRRKRLKELLPLQDGRSSQLASDSQDLSIVQLLLILMSFP